MAYVKRGGNGGRRPGSGRPRGILSKVTLARRWTKDLAREMVRRRITAGLLPMVEAQMAHAQGIGHLYRRDTKGRYTRVERQAEIDAILASGLNAEEGTCWICAKDPSVPAFTDLLNRALDKPVEPHELVADVTLEARKTRLRAARQRVRALEKASGVNC